MIEQTNSEEAQIDALIERLLRWLADKPEDVWLDCVERINWDDGGWTLLAIVSDPRCTKRIAARVFWTAGPIEVARELANGHPLDLNVEGNLVIERILLNWRVNAYRSGSIAVTATDMTYDQYLAELAPQPDPLAIPEELFARFDGRTPDVDPTMTPENDPHVWDLYHPLGLAHEPRPGSPPAVSREQNRVPRGGDGRSRSAGREQNEIKPVHDGERPSRIFGLVLLAFSLVSLFLIYRFG